MAKSRQRRNSVFKRIRGENPPPQKVVLRGMADLEKTLAQRFQERKKELARLAKANAPLRDKLVGVSANDPAWAACSRDAQRVARASLASRRVSVPKALRQKPRASVFLGSNGGARFVPFDYSWTSRSTGEIAVNDLSADKVSGGMRIYIGTQFSSSGNDDGDAGGEAYAALGIFFRLPSYGFSPAPPLGLANLVVSAIPAVNFAWEAFFGPQILYPSAFGFIGLLVQRYDWTVGWASPQSTAASTLFVGEHQLWRDDSLGDNGSGWKNRPWISVPLSAMFLVDSFHWYALWVWCGTQNAGVERYDAKNWSWAESDLRVNVPYISWQFEPLHALP